jgi:hypothetical protein
MSGLHVALQRWLPFFRVWQIQIWAKSHLPGMRRMATTDEIGLRCVSAIGPQELADR